MSHPQSGAKSASLKTRVSQDTARPAQASHLQTARPGRARGGLQTQPSKSAWTVRRKPIEERKTRPMRAYDLLWHASNGDIMEHRATAPALPVFQDAFNAFARGALIPTDNGAVAIEDLLPGDRVVASDGTILPIKWIGSMQLRVAHGDNTAPASAAPESLYRLTADSFGYGRSAPDLVVGAGARYLHRSDALKSYLGTSIALAPVSTLADGHSVIKVTPVSSVRTYHICLPQHKLICVNGVELETYHPGTAASGQLLGELRGEFMQLFPHLTELGDFGAMVHPRLSAGDLLTLNAA